jgi:hypothetical protein
MILTIDTLCSRECNASAELMPLLTNAAFPAFFRAVPTILAVLAGVTRISAGAGSRKNIDRNLIDEKNGQHNLSQDRK